GHWMRALNIARELEAIEPATEIRFFTRSEPWRALGEPRWPHVVAADPRAMDALPDSLAAYAPDVIVDATLPPAELTSEGARHVFVMRRSADARQVEMLAQPSVRAMDAVIVPHARAEFGHELPAELGGRTTFVGPIVRHADPAVMHALRERLGVR